MRSISKAFALLFILVGTAVADEADVRAFVDRATTAFGVPDVALVTLDPDRPQHPYTRRRTIHFPAHLYESPFRFEIAAHELAHAFQGAPTRDRFSIRRAQRQAAQYAREVDANVRAVAILARTEAISEASALHRMYQLLLALRVTQPAPPFGHKDRCIEAADLLERFPEYREQLAQPCPPVTARLELRPPDATLNID